MPGPRAYHGLVFAYVKAGDADGALDAVRAAHEAGIQPIAESYTVLIHAFMQQDNVVDAELVLVSMKRAGLDARPGWLMLTQVRAQSASGRLCAVPKLGPPYACSD